MDDSTTVAQLRALVDRFCEERGWNDPPKDLAVSLIVEAAELLEHFRFRSDAEIEEMLRATEVRLEVAREVADVLYHVLAIARALDFDLSTVFREKLAISGDRYPPSPGLGT